MKKAKYLNMKNQLYLFTFFMALLSIGTISLITYFKSTHEQHQRFSENNQQVIQQLSYNLESYFDDLLRLSVVPAYDKKLISILEDSTAEQKPLDLLEKQRYIENFLDNMMVYPRKDILHAFIIADRVYYGSRYRPGFDSTLTLQELGLDWNALSQGGSVVFLSPYINQLESSPADEVFSVFNFIRSAGPSKKMLAVIKVDADFSTINETCSTIHIGENSGLLLLDGSGKQVYSSLPKTVTAELINELEYDTAEESYDLRLSNGKYLINHVEVGKPGWSIYSAASYMDINAGARSTRNITLLAAFLLAGLTLLITYLFLHRFLAPIYEIMGQIKEVGKGNFQVRFPDSRRDEVGMLGVSMNEVTSQLNHIMKENTALANQVLQARLVEKEAQVNMLYSQIQPHFIYNSLNTVSMSIQMGRGMEAVHMINKLSKLMRSMSKSDSLHSLKAEVELLCDYLDIQKNRYGDRLNYSLQMEDGLETVEIPTLLLQPVAENAVVHGCERGRKKTNIDITVFAVDKQVKIVIQDDGAGIDADTLSLLQERIEHFTSENSEAAFQRGGTGLRNVNQRLKVRYGEQYGLVLSSEVNDGTKIEILIPKKNGKNGV